MNAISHAQFCRSTTSAIALVVSNDDIAPIEEEAVTVEAVAEPEPVAPSIFGEFLIDRTVVQSAIAALVRVVEKRNTLPVLSNVLLHASGGILVATATDLDTQVTAMVETRCDHEFAATIPAHLLADIFRKAAKSDEALFRADDTGDNVVVHLGSRLQYKLPAITPNDFPHMAAPEFSHRFEIAGDVFRGMLESTSRAMSKEETRYYLNGVYLHARDYRRYDSSGEMPTFEVVPDTNRGALIAVATDGHRLYKADIVAPEGVLDMPGVILPRSMVELFLKLTAGKACPASIKVEVSDTKIRLSFGDLEILSKLIDGTFPDYQRVIPTGNDLVSTFKASDLIEALESVSIIASERARPVKLLVEEGRMVLAVNNSDTFGSATMELPATLAKAGVDSPSIEIGFNAGYLSALVKDLSEGGDGITVQFGDAGSPTVFLPGREGFMAVLMPMRV